MKRTLTLISLLFLCRCVIGQDVSSIQLRDVDGKLYSLKEHLTMDGTLILFWATWCLPCQKEFPEVEKLIEKYPQKKINVITISIDSPRSIAKVKSFFNRHRYPFTFLLDSEGAAGSLLLVDNVPQSFIADASGKVVYSHAGYRKGDELLIEEALQKLWAIQK
jgi:cytochrome c biogenesis protein CcmG, thiol:disulfide interchange protein DsbE